MTREAKIGMLTGLGVIVLIGVLLSNYLGADGADVADGADGGVAAGGGVSAGSDGAGGCAGVGASGVWDECAGCGGCSDSGGCAEYAGGGEGIDGCGAPAMTSGPVVGQPVMPVPAGVFRRRAGPKEMNVPTLQLAEANGAGGGVCGGAAEGGGGTGLTFTKDPTPAAAR